MPRLMPPKLGNGKRPSDPLYSSGKLDDSVPVLDVSDTTHELVGAVHDAALDPDDDTGLLTGAVVMVDNPNPADGSKGHVILHIGASTLHEAATEVLGALPTFAQDIPRWIACTDNDLAKILAEHYSTDVIEDGKIVHYRCDVISMEEVGVMTYH